MGVRVYDARFTSGKVEKFQKTEQEQATIDSREVAEMMGIKHWEVLRKIEGTKDRKGYVEILTDNQMVVSDYFIESYYKDASGKLNTCYKITKMGCEFLANKFTGEKGVLFTAKYVQRFNEMEQLLKPKQPQTQLEVLQVAINQMVEQEQKLTQHEERLTAVESKQENIKEVLSLNPTEWRKKVNAILNKIAKERGGFEAFRDIRNESYHLLEERARCQLSIRLKNKKQKAALEGLAKSKLNKINKMDVIADDTRLTEIYLAIIKEMAITYDVELAE